MINSPNYLPCCRAEFKAGLRAVNEAGKTINQ